MPKLLGIVKMAEDEAAAVSNEDEAKKACLVRNQNEKKRRDRFNNLVNELSASLPLAGKKLSKNNILKFAIEHFRQHELASKSENTRAKKLFGKWQPDFLTNEEFRETMIEGLGAIVLALDEAGKIIYVSSNVFSHLGFDEDEILKTSIFEYVHPEDQRTICSLLGAIYSSTVGINTLDVNRFCIRLRCGPQNRGAGEFTTLRCVSKIFREVNLMDTSQQGDACIVLLGKTAFVPTVNSTVLIADATKASKFTTRLDKNWRFECVERSATLTLGYYPIEMLGTCLYEYCHSEDLANLAEYHSMLLYSGVITTCCYRMLTKGQVWIWVRSRCHVSYSQLDSKPESVICVTWPIKCTEFSANQQEMIARDRQLFSQILLKTGEKQVASSNLCNVQGSATSVPSSSSPSSLILSSSQPRVVSNEVSLQVSSDHSRMSYATANNSTALLPTSDSAAAGSLSGMGAYMEDTYMDTAAVLSQSNGHSIVNDSSVVPMGDLDDNALLLGEHVEMPESLSFSQWALHLHLREQYKSLTESIRQQSEQVTVIQRQLSIQKELSELSEQLELQQKLKQQNLSNTFEETRAVIQQKLKELQATVQCINVGSAS